MYIYMFLVFLPAEVRKNRVWLMYFCETVSYFHSL